MEEREVEQRNDLENKAENSEKKWKMRKKSRFNCEKIWKIWKKLKLNSDK